MANVKTNAMRILDGMKIEYNTYTYSKDDDKIDGISVAEKLGKDPKYVYKTLVAEGHSKEIFVFVIPVAEELDLKKAAKAATEKNIHMIHVKDILKTTGYIRGGCSPIGMKKKYKTFIDSSASQIDKIVISGGKIGIQMELAVDDLLNSADAKIDDLI
ncbi:MAG: Cys-tRNA(Pro) deacylase [Tissierellaceae bacterium]|nr:Cys-tRNA(Pro) deacylase [Tissierellaceae bacterium]